jgi:uncharacterized protein
MRRSGAMRGEPQPLAPNWPRYSTRAFPPYRYVPGLNAHPRRDRAGHSFHLAAFVAEPWEPQNWQRLEAWLFGVDLFNYSYWWESHEELEALWLAAGRTSEHARFVQGLIKIAAGFLNHWLEKEIAREQVEAGARAMSSVARTHAGRYMGIEVAPFAKNASAWVRGTCVTAAPVIALSFAPGP